jgi:hypothetical protein
VVGANGPFQELAMRMSKIREVLGMHYRSDTEAGIKLAKESFHLLMRCPSVAGRNETSNGTPVNSITSIGDAYIYPNGLIGRAVKEW